MTNCIFHERGFCLKASKKIHCDVNGCPEVVNNKLIRNLADMINKEHGTISRMMRNDHYRMNKIIEENNRILKEINRRIKNF